MGKKMRNYRCATPEETKRAWELHAALRGKNTATPEELVKKISAVILAELPPEETVSLIRELLRQ